MPTFGRRKAPARARARAGVGVYIWVFCCAVCALPYAQAAVLVGTRMHSASTLVPHMVRRCAAGVSRGNGVRDGVHEAPRPPNRSVASGDTLIIGTSSTRLPCKRANEQPSARVRRVYMRALGRRHEPPLFARTPVRVRDHVNFCLDFQVAHAYQVVVAYIP